MIPDHEITKCPEHEVKSKIGNKFVNEEILEEYSVKIYEIDSYFYEHYRKKYKLMKKSVNTYYLELIFILLNIFSQQKLMKKVILKETLFLKKKDKKCQRKNLIVNLLELIQENYEADYEVSRIKVFISQFKENKIKEKDHKIKELEEQIKELKLQLTKQST